MFITYSGKPFTVEQIKKIIAQVESDPLDIKELQSKREEHKEKLFTKAMWFLLARVLLGVIVIILNLSRFFITINILRSKMCFNKIHI